MLAKAATMVLQLHTSWLDVELLKMVFGAQCTNYLHTQTPWHESSKGQTIAATPHRDGQEQPQTISKLNKACPAKTVLHCLLVQNNTASRGCV